MVKNAFFERKSPFLGVYTVVAGWLRLV